MTNPIWHFLVIFSILPQFVTFWSFFRKNHQKVVIFGHFLEIFLFFVNLSHRPSWRFRHLWRPFSDVVGLAALFLSLFQLPIRWLKVANKLDTLTIFDKKFTQFSRILKRFVNKNAMKPENIGFLTLCHFLSLFFGPNWHFPDQTEHPVSGSAVTLYMTTKISFS